MACIIFLGMRFCACSIMMQGHCFCAAAFLFIPQLVLNPIGELGQGDEGGVADVVLDLAGVFSCC